MFLGLIVIATWFILRAGASAFDDPVYAHPDSVIVRPLHDGKVDRDPRYFGKVPSTETRSLPAREASELVATLRRCDLSDLPIPACGIDPGVAIEFTKGPKTYIVLMCFKCSVYATVPSSFKGMAKAFNHVEPFVHWLKQAFPKETDIQALHGT